MFSLFGPFLQVFGQVKDWIMLELQKTIRVSHLVRCPIVSLLFYKRGWQRGEFKVMKNDHFLVFLVVWVFFPKFLAG